MSGVDHVRFYSSKWRSGCLMLSLEAEGLYIRIASFRWDAGVRVPSDRKKAALLLRINYNKYTKVLDELFTAKLVIDNGDGLVIERAEIEYQAAEDAIRDKARRLSKSNGNGAAGTSDQGCEGQASDDPVKDTGQPAPQVTPLLTGLVTPPTASENHQGNQRPSIDTDYRDGKEEEVPPLPPDGGRVSQSVAQIDDGKPNPHTEALKAFEAYNARALVLGLPQASKLTPDRQRRIRARLRDFGADGWAQALKNLDTLFLRGLTEHRFRADLDFVCQAKSFSKLHDGGYAPAQGTPDGTDRNRPSRNLSKSERLKAAVDRAMHDNVTVFAARSSWKTADDGDAHAVFSGAEIIRA